MGAYKRGLELADLLTDRGIAATVDPRSVTLPGVLITPPAMRYDTDCSATACAYSAVDSAARAASRERR